MKAALHSVLSIFLIGAVILLGVSPETFHNHEEHGHHCEDDHSVGEADACHMRIFHDDDLGGCNEHQHLMDGPEDCLLCQLQLPSFQVLSFLQDAENCNHSTSNSKQLLTNAAAGQGFSNENQGRGPPHIA